MDRRTLRRLFLSAFEAERLEYVDGGCQIGHPGLTWSISLVVDGTGPRAPSRLVLGASVAQLGDLAPRDAEDCYLVLPLGYDGDDQPSPQPPHMTEAVFPDWPGEEDGRAEAIRRCVASAAHYARQVDSIDELRARYSAGDYDRALIIAPLRHLLEDG